MEVVLSDFLYLVKNFQKMKFVAGLFFLGIMLISCNDSQKENEMNRREAELSKKEALFAQKESEYQSLLKMRDSLFASKDSLAVKEWPAFLSGIWNAKTICTESNCSNYVIGDQRTDSWQFISDGNGLSVKVMSNNDLVRIYNGSYLPNEIKLNFRTDSTAQKQVDMSVVLNDFSSGKIKGSRKVTVDGSCSASFVVELVKATK